MRDNIFGHATDVKYSVDHVYHKKCFNELMDKVKDRALKIECHKCGEILYTSYFFSNKTLKDCYYNLLTTRNGSLIPPIALAFLSGGVSAIFMNVFPSMYTCRISSFILRISSFVIARDCVFKDLEDFNGLSDLTDSIIGLATPFFAILVEESVLKDLNLGLVTNFAQLGTLAMINAVFYTTAYGILYKCSRQL